MKKTWTLDVDGAPHTIELEHSYWMGTRKITVDGRLAHASKRTIDFGSNTPLEIGSHRVNVVVTTNGITFRYDIALDGVSVTTGRPVAAEQGHLPWWGWLLAAGCLAIPFVTIGGILPVVIGAGGMLMVISNATNQTLPERTRLLRCVSVAVASWAALALVFFLFTTVLS